MGLITHSSLVGVCDEQAKEEILSCIQEKVNKNTPRHLTAAPLVSELHNWFVYIEGADQGDYSQEEVM